MAPRNGAFGGTNLPRVHLPHTALRTWGRWSLNPIGEKRILAMATQSPQPPVGRTYEMLWDCPHCGTRNNLGLTHRHCPSCGSPQDASWRYFPADSEKVAVEDHLYAGADLRCGYCGAFNSRRSKHCGGCGAPLEGAAEAPMRGEQVTQGLYGGETRDAAHRELGRPQALCQNNRPTRRVWPWVVGGLLLVGLAVIMGLFVFKQDAELKVAGHTWKREVIIERFGPVREDRWCDSLPAGARNVSRSREVRSHEKVADGQECKTRRKDRGDGTYVEQEECTTRYKDRPVYDDKCTYTVDKWAHARSEKLVGGSAKDPPRWPSVQLARTGTCVGCEREAKREEEYSVRFVGTKDGDESTCEFDQRRWSGFEVGKRFRGQTSVIGNALDCDALKAL